MPTPHCDKVAFLQYDFYDSLRWLFVGALAWKAAETRPRVEHQGVLGMYTAAVQARALYEFFYGSSRADDGARAQDFMPSERIPEKEWAPEETDLYRAYMGKGKPANKRMFHLVYGRAGHSGGYRRRWARPSQEPNPQLRRRIGEVVSRLRRVG